MYQKSTVREVLGRVSKHFGCKNDIDLARVFGVANNTISGWSQRETIPYKYLHELSIKNKISMDTLIYGDECTPKIDEHLFLLILTATNRKFDGNDLKPFIKTVTAIYNNSCSGLSQEERYNLAIAQCGLLDDIRRIDL